VSAVLFPKGEPKHLTVAIFIEALGKVLAALYASPAAANTIVVEPQVMIESADRADLFVTGLPA